MSDEKRCTHCGSEYYYDYQFKAWLCKGCGRAKSLAEMDRETEPTHGTDAGEICLCSTHSPTDQVDGAVYDPGGWRVPNPHCPIDHGTDEGEGETERTYPMGRIEALTIARRPLDDEFDDDGCYHCHGEGGFHNCGEDSCCCLDKEEITETCPVCKGSGDAPAPPQATDPSGGSLTVGLPQNPSFVLASPDPSGVVERLKAAIPNAPNHDLLRCALTLIQSQADEIEGLKNDLADALDLKNGVGPTVLTALVAQRNALMEGMRSIRDYWPRYEPTRPGHPKAIAHRHIEGADAKG